MKTERWQQWCPLFGKISFIDIPPIIPITRARKIKRCIDFIKEARNIWKCPSLELETNYPKPEKISNYQPTKVISAREIFDLLIVEYELIWNQGNNMPNHTIETLLTNAISRVRKLSKLNSQVTDSEIYAIFTILGARNALFLMLVRGVSEDHLHVSATVESAYLSLSLAEQSEQLSQQQQQPVPESEIQINTLRIPSQFTLKGNAFYKEDDTWFIKYEGEVFRPKDDDGFCYIAELLTIYPKGQTPEQLYHTIKVVETGRNSNKEAIESAIAEGDLNKLHTIKSRKLSKKEYEKSKYYVEEIEKELENLKEEKETYENEGYETRAEELQEEIDRKKELLKIIKLNPFDKEHKNKYNMVGNAINRAIKKIRTLSNEKNYTSMLTLKHLKNSIKYERSQFLYIPEKYPYWQF